MTQPAGITPGLREDLARHFRPEQVLELTLDVIKWSYQKLPVALGTRVFGDLRGDLEVPVSDERVDWEPRLVFPELRQGEELRRTSVPPTRATLHSRDGKVLAEGPGSPAAFARWADRAGHVLLGVERAADAAGRPAIRLLIRKGA